MFFQKRWHCLSNGAGRFLPTSLTTMRGRNVLIWPVTDLTATIRRSSSQSASRHSPKVYMYSLLSRTKRKPFLKNLVTRFLDTGEDLFVGHSLKDGPVLFDVGSRSIQRPKSRLRIDPPTSFYRSFQCSHIIHANTIQNPAGRVKAIRIPWTGFSRPCPWIFVTQPKVAVFRWHAA